LPIHREPSSRSLDVSRDLDPWHSVPCSYDEYDDILLDLTRLVHRREQKFNMRNILVPFKAKERKAAECLKITLTNDTRLNKLNDKLDGVTVMGLSMLRNVPPPGRSGE
jgi:hypothetical protein